MEIWFRKKKIKNTIGSHGRPPINLICFFHGPKVRICAPAVCVATKTWKNTLTHKRHHPKTNVPLCSFVYLCICLRAKEITALLLINSLAYSLNFSTVPTSTYGVCKAVHGDFWIWWHFMMEHRQAEPYNGRTFFVILAKKAKSSVLVQLEPYSWTNIFCNSHST